VGALMCFLQRHLKRLLAYSTIAHVGLFLTALATLDGPGTTGAALYVLGHAGVKGALFLLAGTLLNRYGSVDEITLHGRGKTARVAPWLFVVAGLALAGLPPFGTGLGKAVGEEALLTGGYLFGPLLFVAVSAVTGAAVLRAGARIYFGLGPVPAQEQEERTDDQPEQETGDLARIRITMFLPIVVLLAAGFAVGVVPAVGRAVSTAAVQFVDGRGYVHQALAGGAATVPHPLPEAEWTTAGVLLGLLSALLAVGLAAMAVWAPRLPAAWRVPTRPLTASLSALRRLHSGHVGDYVAWLFLGAAGFATLLAVPLL
jgi:multicomponent Na+:H+ antiporter subunit D